MTKTKRLIPSSTSTSTSTKNSQHKLMPRSDRSSALDMVIFLVAIR